MTSVAWIQAGPPDRISFSIAAETTMLAYRFLFSDLEDEIVAAFVLHLPSDDDARRDADALLMASRYRGVEVWQGSHCLYVSVRAARVLEGRAARMDISG